MHFAAGLLQGFCLVLSVEPYEHILSKKFSGYLHLFTIIMQKYLVDFDHLDYQKSFYMDLQCLLNII